MAIVIIVDSLVIVNRSMYASKPYPGVERNRMYLRWILCNLCLLACQLRVTVSDSCLCCVCVRFGC